MSARDGINHPYIIADPVAASTTEARRGRGMQRRLAPHGLAGLALAVLLGLGFACWLYGYAMLRGSAPFWWRDNTDIAQYLAGFNAFVHEPWHWPLLRIDSLNAPQGTLATFLDTVPLYAVFLKVVHPGTGFWNPYGLWIALCFALQGVGAWWICREARVRSWAALVAMTLLLASFPALTARIHHTSLMSQWLLVFALAIYLRSARLGRLAALHWGLLLVGGFYINIYLFAMASTIFAADLLRALQRSLARAPSDLRSILRILYVPAAIFGLLFASMAVTMLPMPAGSGTGEWGFGFYSMNLLAPLHGGTLLHLEHPIAHDGQGEGYSYLGIFMLALTAFAVRLRQQHDPAFWQRHRILLVTFTALTLYALSNRVHFGNTLLYSLQLPSFFDGVTSTFRASGRFFWPVGYAIIVFAVLGIARYRPGWRGGALLAALVMLQCWDLREHHERTRASLGASTPQVIDPARWDGFLGAGIHSIYYYPPFHCAPTPPMEALVPTMVYAVKHNYAMSTGYIARAVKSCEHFGKEITRLPADTAVAFEKQVYPKQQDAERLMGQNAICADMRIVYLCRRNDTNGNQLIGSTK